MEEYSQDHFDWLFALVQLLQHQILILFLNQGQKQDPLSPVSIECMLNLKKNDIYHK